MRDLWVPEELLAKMARHAHSEYPNECCGFLIATTDPSDPREPRRVVAVEPASNEFDGERRRRFLLSPDELRAAERRLEGTNRSVVGFYHSHPDHPGRPSEFDRQHAWPWYTYVVLGVQAGELRESRAFELDPDSLEFREMALTVDPGEARPAPPMAGG